MRLLSSPFCLFLFSSLSVFGQKNQTFEVNFSTPAVSESLVYVLHSDIQPTQHPFTGISAYSKSDLSHLEFLQYRIFNGKSWDAWVDFKAFHEGALEDRQSFEGEAYEGHFEKIQFRRKGRNKHTFVFRLYFPPTGIAAEASTQNTNSSCSCIQPFYCDRSCWCPDGSCPKDLTPSFTTPTHLIVHHSAGSNSSNDYAAVVSYIWDLHVNTNGWDDIGYNWLIDPNGVIYEGRGDGVSGAHFSCMNGNTTGICLLGNFETQAPATLAVDALKDFLAWEACDKNIVPDVSGFHSSSQMNLEHISGHRDGNSATVGCPKGTACPGDSLYILLTSIRTDVANNPCINGVSLKEWTLFSIDVFPNPTEDKMIVSFGEEGAVPSVYQVELINSAGALVQQYNVRLEQSNKSMEVNTNNLPQGAYWIKITSETHNYTGSFIKN
jgi:hypothetical protein